LKKKRINKTQAVKGYLLKYKGISRTTAQTHFEAYCLPQIMAKLKPEFEGLNYAVLTIGKGAGLCYRISNKS